MSTQRRDYDSELAHLLALFREHDALLESFTQVPLERVLEPAPTLTWVVENSGDREKSDADA